LKSFYVQEKDVELVNQSDPETRLYYERFHVNFGTRDQRFGHVEHLSEISSFPDVYSSESDSNLELFLPSLKHVRVYADDDD